MKVNTKGCTISVNKNGINITSDKDIVLHATGGILIKRKRDNKYVLTIESDTLEMTDSLNSPTVQS